MKSLSKSSKAKSLLLQSCESCYFRAACQMFEFTSYPNSCKRWTVDGPAFDGDDYHRRVYQSMTNFAGSEEFKRMIKRNYYDEE